MKPSVSFVSVAVVLLSSLVVACGATNEDDTTSSEGAATESPASAVIETTPSTLTNGRCNVLLTEIQVSGIDPAVAARINAALRAKRETEASDMRDCNELALDFSSTMTLVHNGGGFLSINEVGYLYREPAAHDEKFVFTHNFDLATGATVLLKDLLTERGVTKAIAPCDEGIRRAALENDAAEATLDHQCASELREEAGSARFTFNKEGIHVHPSFGTALFVLEMEGAPVPWSALDRDLTKRGVAVMRSTQ